jgi:hypothetical protein
MTTEIMAFYSDLWNNQEQEQEQKNIKKFYDDENNKELFNIRYKEDLEVFENDKSGKKLKVIIHQTDNTYK